MANYNTHLTTKKHKNNKIKNEDNKIKNENNKIKNEDNKNINISKFNVNCKNEFKNNKALTHNCKYCNFSTIHLANYNTHLTTKKHKNNKFGHTIKDNNNSFSVDKIYELVKSQNIKIDNLTKQNNNLRKKMQNII